MAFFRKYGNQGTASEVFENPEVGFCEDGDAVVSDIRKYAGNFSWGKWTTGVCMENSNTPFWKIKNFAEMTRTEWESLCDGCGRCCLEKLKDNKTGKVFYTDLACRYLDLNTCLCTVYEYRTKLVPDCEYLIPQKVQKYRWLPKSCAYRLLAEGKELAWWHPLVSGDRNTVHVQGISVRGRAISALGVPESDFESHIIPRGIWARSASVGD